MPRLCATGALRDEPGTLVQLIQNDDLWYRVVTNDTPDINDEMDVLVHSTMEFADAYRRFLSLI